MRCCFLLIQGGNMKNEIILHELTERISSISEEIAMYNEDEEIELDE